MSIYYSTSHRHAVYEAFSNSKKQGAGPIEEFYLEVESARFQLFQTAARLSSRYIVSKGYWILFPSECII
jgi:hypothetical protein